MIAYWRCEGPGEERAVSLSLQSVSRSEIRGAVRGRHGVMRRQKSRLWEDGEELESVSSDNLTVCDVCDCPRDGPGGAQSSWDKVVEV